MVAALSVLPKALTMSETIAMNDSVVRDTWLRQWRLRTNRTQADAGASAGVSHNRWSEIERGAAPDYETALQIERVTGIAPRDFFRRDKLRRIRRR